MTTSLGVADAAPLLCHARVAATAAGGRAVGEELVLALSRAVRLRGARLLLCGIVAFASCASMPADPTPQRPRIGCVADSMAVQSSVPGKLMPRIVRVIGTYEHDDSQWMVIFADEYNGHWVPVDKRLVRFADCGREADAFRELFSAPASALPPGGNP